jgi:hypothetical protein
MIIASPTVAADPSDAQRNSTCRHQPRMYDGPHRSGEVNDSFTRFVMAGIMPSIAPQSSPAIASMRAGA